MGRIIAIANQKGGVGKTTTTVSLGAAMAIAERPVLVVDADPQANTTRAFGFPAEAERASLYSALVGESDIESVTLTSPDLPHLSLVPADQDLVGAEVELVDEQDRAFRLRRALESARDRYDRVFIDCPPSLGLLTLNALAAADSVLIPVQCEYFALEGISQLMETIRQVRAAIHPELQVEGVVLTMYDDRTNLAKQVADEVREVFGAQVFETLIPRNIRLAEAPSHGQPIFLYDIRSRGADAYFALAKEMLNEQTESAGQGTP